MEKAKPCPFCGDPNPQQSPESHGTFVEHRLECGECGCLGPTVTYDSSDSDEEPTSEEELQASALRLWNKRP